MIMNIYKKVYLGRVSCSHEVVIRVRAIVPVSDTTDNLREYPPHVRTSCVSVDMVNNYTCVHRTEQDISINVKYPTLLYSTSCK